jgi:uncharacterized OB-fold protein
VNHKQKTKRYRPLKEAKTVRCPSCGGKFYIERPEQTICVPCQAEQDTPERTQRYIVDKSATVSIGCVTSDPGCQYSDSGKI